MREGKLPSCHYAVPVAGTRSLKLRPIESTPALSQRKMRQRRHYTDALLVDQV